MKTEEKWNGLALAGACIIILIFLSFNLDYLGNVLISRIASIIIGIIGIIGMTIELSKLIEKKINGITDFGVGITLLVIWWSIYYYFNHPICNFLILFLLLLGCYGCLIGIAKILYKSR